MIRFAWLGLRLFILILAAVWLSNHPGKVAITWQGYLLETSVGALIVIVLVTLGVFILVAKLAHDLLRLPERWSQHKILQTDRRGRKALTGGLAAVASGDADAAKRLARQTEAAIVDPVLSHLLAAEALILSGENDAAESQFELLLGRDDTRVIGHRGLIEVALARGDWMRAYTRARKARAVMPKSPWLMTLLVDLAVRAGDLEEARLTLDQAVRSRALQGYEAQRRQTALWTAQGLKAERDGDARQALALAEKVLAEDAGFVPAAVLAVRLNRGNDRLKTAERIVERAWEIDPHPDLIEAWRDLGTSDDPSTMVEWMKRLADARPDHAGAALAYAEAAIEARQWGEARRVLEPMAATVPAREAGQACLLLGQLEREETGNLAAAVVWYERAGDSLATGSRWICHGCGDMSARWSELCAACGAFAHIHSPDRKPVAPPARPAPTSLPGIGMPLSQGLPMTGINDDVPRSATERTLAAP
jgi:HemY protein